MKKYLQLIIINALSLLVCLSNISFTQTSRALLIGINNYHASEKTNINTKGNLSLRFKDLKGAVNDIDGIYSLLISKFNFLKDEIIVLKDNDATRDNIIKSLNELIEKSNHGDNVLFYYSGHGSQVYNSKSREEDKKDESIVPADGKFGAKDIRDKELAVFYDKILNRGAELTVIMDCCHSGSNTRGLARSDITRNISAVDADVADPAYIFPSAEERGALILSASQDYETAAEIIEDSSHFGLFSYCLAKTLREAPKNISVSKLFLQTKALMRSFGYYQEPVLSGQLERREKPLFDLSGIIDNTVQVAVAHVNPYDGVEILGGIALGLFPSSELVKTSDAGNKTLKLRVKTNIGIALSSCEVIEGDINQIKAGDLFKISKLASNYNSSLKIWVPYPLNEEDIFKVQKEFRKLEQVKGIIILHDPTEVSPDYTIYFENNNWNLTDNSSRVIQLNNKSLSESVLKQLDKNPSSKKIFICYPPTEKILNDLKASLTEKDLTIELTDKKEFAQYFLAGRVLDEKLEYSLIMPNITGEQLSQIALPVRSDWWINNTVIAEKIIDGAMKINRVKGWMQLNSSSENSAFCYKLGIKKQNAGEILNDGVLHEGDTCSIVLITNPDVTPKTEGRYIYVFNIDMWGKSNLLYPPERRGNVENRLNCRQNGEGGKDKDIVLGRFKIVPPLGVDNYYLLTTTEPLPDPTILHYSGARTRGDEKSNSLESLIKNIGYSTRGDYYNPENWSIERCSFITLKKEK